MKQLKASTVTLPPEVMEQLRFISATRKSKHNLAWSHINIVNELIKIEAKKIKRGK